MKKVKQTYEQYMLSQTLVIYNNDLIYPMTVVPVDGKEIYKQIHKRAQRVAPYVPDYKKTDILI